MNNIVVTGGSGMVGSAVRSILPNEVYLDSKSFYGSIDLEGKRVLHLAARVGGIKANTDYVGEFFLENSVINQSILERARIGKASKVLSLLSTCIYPDSNYVTYPLTEDQLHLGPPHSSNFGYAYSKRMLDVMSRAYRQQYGCNFITAVPNNLYGENDSFNLNNGHVIPSLIRKVFEAKLKNERYVEVWGDGSPLREFTYSLDIANILIFLLEEYDEEFPINIGNNEEYSIKEVAELICKCLGYNGSIEWNVSKPNGQHRKPSSNKRLVDLGWNPSKFTPIQVGIRKTCDWFLKSYPKVRL